MLTDLTVSMYALAALSGDQTSFISRDDLLLASVGLLCWVCLRRKREVGFI